METVWIILVLQAFICGFLAMNVAEHKGYSTGAWFGSGFFLGIFGLIAAAGLPTKQTTTSLNRLSKKCPECAESIYKEAFVCKFCGKQFSKGQVVADLLEVLQGKSGANDLQALDALHFINDASVVPCLIKLIGTITIESQMDINDRVLNKAVKLLEELGSPANSPDLVSIVKKTQVVAKSNKLIELLGSYHDISSLPVLIDSLQKQELRSNAINAIEKYGESALPDLEKMAKDGKRTERRIADEIMTRIKSKSTK